MQRITVKEYFDYLNKYIDSLSDEELLKLLEEDEGLDEDLYDDEFCYDFELVPPAATTQEEPNHNEIDNEIDIEEKRDYYTFSSYVFQNDNNISIECIDYILKVA